MASAVPAIGADVPMVGGRIAKLKDKTGTANDEALVKFSKDSAFSALPPSPVCPAVSTIRLRTDSQDVLTTLDCTHWASTGSGYSYHDVTAGSGGVQKMSSPPSRRAASCCSRSAAAITA
jgi:hypothetical protein